MNKMTTTPISKHKLSRKSTRDMTELKKGREDPPILHTPSNKYNASDTDNEYSPLYFSATQESNEDIDVLWDWNSPQSSNKRRKKLKRLIPIQSPKFPIRRQHSHTDAENFERLRNELKALQEELAVPDDDICLSLSPQQETEFKSGVNNSPQATQVFDDLFNDSMDEQLALFSQQVENDFAKGKNLPNDNSEISDECIANLIDKYTATKDNSVWKNNIENEPKKSSFLRTNSENSLQINHKSNIIETASGKLEFHRTRSFELSKLSVHNDISKVTADEIERKRLEALAKLESRKKTNIVPKSQSKCTQNEIEKKRLEALAKLEAKRVQDVVEKKRQEALKKLQNNRLKNASSVKGTLCNKF